MTKSNDWKSNQDPLSKKNSGRDQRYFPRWEVDSRVIYKIDNDPMARETHTKDLNCSGVCIYVQEAIKPQQRLKLTIYLSGRKSVDVQGLVIWNNPLENQALVGICFSNTSQKAQDLILQHAFEIKKEDLTKHWFKGWK